MVVIFIVANATGKRCVFKIKEIMEKEIKKLSADSLVEYVNKQRTQEECIGFIDGFAEAVRLLKKHGFLTDVIKRFEIGKEVIWKDKPFYVVEEKDVAILVSNGLDKDDDLYCDWWVNKSEVNVL